MTTHSVHPTSDDYKNSEKPYTAPKGLDDWRKLFYNRSVQCKGCAIFPIIASTPTMHWALQ